ncbi:MAG: putative DNA (cytosine-5)-methyltransferase [Prokaryotic dsDNA virus sp.]|nr:MAG: putative DNA (cytosine-5)-methyltransferase [Prokaryotic dsDNA virus sp.]|tara:strand:+ start:3907 stop:4557 length:651 start_codon:yes stop_codon:yes gene_type:complete
MNVLELFAGSRSFSKVADSFGYKTFTSDIKPFDKIDYVTDILKFDCAKVPFKPDCIWSSPPCTFFSVASIGKHWNKDHTPKTKEAILGCKIVIKTLEIIDYFQPDYFFIENPRGKLRKLSFMQKLPRTTVTYCSYGDKRMKPTDIWTNYLLSNDLFGDNKLQGWLPKPVCNNRQKDNICHHEKAPRGSKTGTQGLKDNYERSKVPYELCLEILKSI